MNGKEVDHRPSALERRVWYHLATDPILEGTRQRGYLDAEAAADELIDRRGLGWDKAEIVSAIHRYDPPSPVDLRGARDALTSAEVKTRRGLTRVVATGAARSDERILSALPHFGNERTVLRFHGKRALEAIIDAECEEELAETVDHGDVSIEGSLAQLRLVLPEGPAVQEAFILVLTALTYEDVSLGTASYAHRTFSAFVPSAELQKAKATLENLGVSLADE